MKPVQCKNCKYFVRDIFYKSVGICSNDGRYTREHCVCNLLDTNKKKRDAKIKAVSSSVCTCEMPAKMKGKNQCWRCKSPITVLVYGKVRIKSANLSSRNELN